MHSMEKIVKVIFFIVTVNVFQVFSQSKEFKILSPKPYECLIVRKNTTVSWDAPDNIKDNVQIIISKGEQSTVLKKKTILETGECFFSFSSKVLPGSDYFLQLKTLGSPSYTAKVGPLLVSRFYNVEKKYVHLAIPLGWAPTKPFDPIRIKYVKLDRLKNISIDILPIEDTRKYKSLVGGLYDDKYPEWKCIVLTKDTVSTWLHKKLTDLFYDFGIPTGKNAKVKIQVKLFKFFVKEADRYECEIITHTTFLSPDGTKIWEGIVRANAGDWGKTYNKGIYQGCISDCFMNFSISILENLSLQVKKIEL